VVYDNSSLYETRIGSSGYEQLKKANDMNANLLLNTGPLPDGSIHPEDVKVLKKVGSRLRKQ